MELTLAEHAAAEQRLADCIARMRSCRPSLAYRPLGWDLPALLGDATVELQRLAGSAVQSRQAHPGGNGFLRLLIEFEEEELGRACLGTA